MKDIKQQLEDQYDDLQAKINEYLAGECKAPDVKHKSALLGIYKERNDSFMLRIRRTAGHTSPQNFRDIADISDRFSIDHGHFSTRQNIQMHGVPGEHVADAIRAFNAADLNFRGGGGNTFRNVATSPLSGVSPTETFDTVPHTRGVWNWVYYYEKAYQFCRKFKLGFTSEEFDDSNAGIQDLGFVAKIKDGERGFKVYGAGGMGRGASLGTVLFEFLPEKDIIRASQAMIDLFYDHGDREVRAKARLRFVLQRLGEEEFHKLFFSYYEKADAPDYIHEAIDYTPELEALKKNETEAAPSEGFEQWKQRAVSPTKFGDEIVSVRLYIRRGNFNANDFRSFADILDAVGSKGIRLIISQDAVIPLVHKSKLTELYTLLSNKLPNQAVVDGRFKKQIVSCIGAAECPIGILQSPVAAEAVAEALDDLFDEYSELRSELYESVLDGINISGCASSCGLNLVAGLGFHGMKKRLDGELFEIYQVYVGGQIDETNHQLAKTDASWLVKADDIDSFVSAVVRSYVESYKAGTKETMREYLLRQRESFNPAEFGGIA